MVLKWQGSWPPGSIAWRTGLPFLAGKSGGTQPKACLDAPVRKSHKLWATGWPVGPHSLTIVTGEFRVWCEPQVLLAKSQTVRFFLRKENLILPGRVRRRGQA